MTAALGVSVPGEARSTCEACPTCAPHGPFHVDVRCCGHVPAQPNFVVGGVLGDPDAPGRDALRARVAARHGVTPLGLGPTPTEAAAIAAVPFGSDPALACPYLDRGRCGVWRHREAVCATWFCRVDRGEVGQRAQLELRALLQAIERALSRKLARDLGARPEGRGPSAWGGWAGREEAYFLACAARASAMSWPEVRRVVGMEATVRLRALQPALAARLDPALPRGPLWRADRVRERLADGRVRVRTWSVWDPAVLTAEEDEALDAQDGLAAADRLATIGVERLRELVDHGVLVERVV